MTIEEPEKAAIIKEVPQQVLRKAERFYAVLLVVVGLASGLLGAYLGLKALLMAYGSVAVYVVFQAVIDWVAKKIARSSKDA